MTIDNPDNADTTSASCAYVTHECESNIEIAQRNGHRSHSMADDAHTSLSLSLEGLTTHAEKSTLRFTDGRSDVGRSLPFMSIVVRK